MIRFRVEGVDVGHTPAHVEVDDFAGGGVASGERRCLLSKAFLLKGRREKADSEKRAGGARGEVPTCEFGCFVQEVFHSK